MVVCCSLGLTCVLPTLHAFCPAPLIESPSSIMGRRPGAPREAVLAAHAPGRVRTRVLLARGGGEEWDRNHQGEVGWQDPWAVTGDDWYMNTARIHDLREMER